VCEIWAAVFRNTFLSAVGDLGPASAARDHMPQHIITLATGSDMYTSGVHYKTPLELAQVASAGGGTHMIRAIDTFRTLLQAIAPGHTTTATIRLIVLESYFRTWAESMGKHERKGQCGLHFPNGRNRVLWKEVEKSFVGQTCIGTRD
jgi:hypothetical protein